MITPSTEGAAVRTTRIMPNLRVPDVATAKSFYAGFLGLSTEELSLGWVARYTSPDSWGVRRFFVRAPDGNVITVVGHRD